MNEKIEKRSDKIVGSLFSPLTNRERYGIIYIAKNIAFFDFFTIKNTMKNAKIIFIFEKNKYIFCGNGETNEKELYGARGGNYLF